MKYRYTPWLPVIAALAFCACSEQQEGSECLSPKQKYDKAVFLLKPNVENAQSDYAGAMALLTAAANEGYLPAQLDLAGIYLFGNHDGSVKKDLDAAFTWYQRAEKQGSNDALYYQGLICLEKGDTATAEQLIQKAADAGMAEACYRLSVLLFAAHKDEVAMRYLRRAAKDSLPEAMFFLGQKLYQQQSPEASDWFHRAAHSPQLGTVAKAAYALACVYRDGYGRITPDMEKAVEWYKMSADAGYPQSQYIVGTMYVTGQCLPQNKEKGLAMLRLSAGQDYIPGIEAYIEALRLYGADEAAVNEAAAWEERLRKLRQK